MKKLLKNFILFSVLIFPLSLNAATPLTPSKNGIVVSTNDYANKIGMKVLDEGGNAFDAAVAVGYALAVTHPTAGNIGGGGFAVIHTADGKDYALDFREVAPSKAGKDMYLDKDGNVIENLSVVGYLAAGVPGTVAGMSAINEKFGTKSLAELIKPSIELSENGFILTERQGETWDKHKDEFKKFESSKKYFLKENGEPYKSTELFVQKDLAKTLKLIADLGQKAFYEGEIADLIEKDMQKNGGIITKEDLANYKVIWREPIRGNYRGYEIISMSPPSSGGAHLIQILNVMENYDIKGLGFGSSETINIMSEAERYAYADRSEYMGDPDFVNIPLKKLISKEYAKEISNKITVGKAVPSDSVKPGLGTLEESNNTTHYSIVDKDGNAVSITYTINGTFGSFAAVDGAGFLLNNEMDDFSIKLGVPNMYGLIGKEANAIVNNKRPLSSMTPTLITKDHQLLMVVGSPGGARIITTVLQVISNVLDHEMKMNQAVQAPRYHMQWYPDEIRYEPFGMTKDTKVKLEGMGYTIVEKPLMGDVNAIYVDPVTKNIYGSKDTRREF